MPRASKRPWDEEFAEQAYRLELARLVEEARQRERRRVLPDVSGWRGVARPDQLPPGGEWLTWLCRGGRGSGKSWSASHVFAEWVTAADGGEWAIVAPTWRRLRSDCIESLESGLLVALGGERGGWVESYNRSTMEIHLVNGAKIVLASSEDGASAVEGKNLSGAWCEELGLWSRWEVAWDRALRPALRKADARVIATGTPRFGMPAAKLIRRLLDDPSVPVSTLRTIDNAANLNAERLADLERIKHTRLGRQELEGELVEDNPDALWNPDLIEAHRRILGPGESWEDLRLTRVVIGVDPAVTSHKPGELREEVFGEDGTRKPSDQTGIVVMGLGVDGHGYVLADLTGWFRPEEMARVVIGAYQRWMADRVIVEVNNGGDYIPAILASADSTVPVRQVRASRGKVTRAEPVAAAYASGLVHHVGVFGELEEQMCNWSPALGSSPDRVDALVWAATALKLTVETVGWGDVWAPKPKPVDGFAPPNPWLEVYSN